MIRLPEDREIAAHYFGHVAQHPRSLRTKAAFSKLPGCPTPADLAAHVGEAKMTSPQKAKVKDCLGRLYPQWLLEMELGFNIFGYGYGSKIEALDAFLASPLTEHLHQFVFRAYRKDVSFGAFVELLEDSILPETIERVRGNPTAQIRRICDYLSDDASFEPFILIAIHQIDSPILRSHQDALVALAACPRIRLLCTVDHANPTLLWTPAQFHGFRAAWHDITTLRPYRDELARILDGSHRSAAAGAVSLESCRMVLQALPKNAQGIFRILVEHQLKTMGNKTKAGAKPSDDSDNDDDEGDEEEEWEAKAIQSGLSFYAWYQSAQEAFIANSENAFRIQLAEFTDHQLVIGVDNPMASGQIYYLPFSTEQLTKLLAFL
jgi:origin recognition complex subunit 2